MLLPEILVLNQLIRQISKCRLQFAKLVILCEDSINETTLLTAIQYETREYAVTRFIASENLLR